MPTSGTECLVVATAGLSTPVLTTLARALSWREEGGAMHIPKAANKTYGGEGKKEKRLLT